MLSILDGKGFAYKITEIDGCSETLSVGLYAEWYEYLAGGRGPGNALVTAASFAIENAPKCTILRVKFLLMAKSSPR